VAVYLKVIDFLRETGAEWRNILVTDRKGLSQVYTRCIYIKDCLESKVKNERIEYVCSSVTVLDMIHVINTRHLLQCYV
jgi:hypothetical protein